MSVSDITRASFSSGVSPLTWSKLVRTATGGPYHGELYGPEICETLLALLGTYTPHPLLLTYLSLALGLPPPPQPLPTAIPSPAPPPDPQPLIPLYVYVHSLIIHLGHYPPSLHLPLAEPLCALALRTNSLYNTPGHPRNPLLPLSASPLPLLPPYVSLLTSLSTPPIPPTPSPSVPELLLHILNLLHPPLHLPSLTPQEKHELLGAIDASYAFAGSGEFGLAQRGLARVRQLVRMMDEGEFVGLSGASDLGFLVQPQPLLPQHAPSSASSPLAPSMPLLSLFLSSLLENRSTPFGAGSHPSALSTLHALLPTSPPTSAAPTTPSNPNLANPTSPSPAEAEPYYALLMAALGLVAQRAFPVPPPPQEDTPEKAQKRERERRDAVLWRAFVLGRLPALIPTEQPGFARAIERVWESGARVLELCEVPGQATHESFIEGEDDRPPSFRLELLRALVSTHVLDEETAIKLCPSFVSLPPALVREAGENLRGVEEYLEERLSGQMGEDDALAFLTRVVEGGGVGGGVGGALGAAGGGDWRGGGMVAGWFHDRFASATPKKSTELEPLSHACRLLTTHPTVLDVVAMYVPISEMVEAAGEFLEGFDFDAIGDPQSALGLYGDIVLFCQFALAKYHLHFPRKSDSDSPPAWNMLLGTSRRYSLNELSEDERALMGRWVKSLFSRSSEGIDDAMLRSTDPEVLLKLTTTIFYQAILARSMDVIDSETLHNGVAYFLSSLLNWTLVGIVHYLVAEAERQGPYSALHFEILQTLLVSGSCPKPVLAITGASVVRLMTNERLVSAMEASGFNAVEMRETGAKAIGTHEDPFTDYSFSHTLAAWSDNCQSAIREAFTQAQMNKVTTFELDRYLSILGPRHISHVVWDACLSGATMGANDGCRIVTAFVLSSLRSPVSPPLLPYFLDVFVPWLLAELDEQSPQQHATALDTLVSIVVSSCHLSSQLERSFLKVADGAPLCVELRCRLQPRQWLNVLFARLESMPGQASRALLKRLHAVLGD